MRKTEQCPTGKIIYPSKGAALRAAIHIKKTKTGFLNTYHCPTCKQYHITSVNRYRKRKS